MKHHETGIRFGWVAWGPSGFMCEPGTAEAHRTGGDGPGAWVFRRPGLVPIPQPLTALGP